VTYDYAGAVLFNNHMSATVIQPKWHTVAEVAAMLGFGLSKTRMLVLTGEIRSVKIGRNRRILPEWVDEYVQRPTADVTGWSA
jgi:excisionase family DNA binding protein